MQYKLTTSDRVVFMIKIQPLDHDTSTINNTNKHSFKFYPEILRRMNALELPENLEKCSQSTTCMAI